MLNRKIFIPLFFMLFANVLLAEDFWRTANTPLEIEAFIDSLTDEECLGQVLLLGYSSDYIDPAVIQFFAEKNIGGMKIFGWNTRNVEVMMSSINRVQEAFGKTKNRIPVFAATDQEGGWVRHVFNLTSPTPGNLSLGADSLLYDTYESSRIIAMELNAMGINMNFAPTVDLLLNQEAHVIGPRAFSDDPKTTALLSIAYYQGQKNQGVVATAKHFPGHGNTNKDSHGILPIMPQSLEELLNQDLVPYKSLITEGLPAVMVGHLAFPEITGSNIPATLSPYFLKTLLREQLGFKGLVITDDMIMSGVRDTDASLGQVCLKALMAGSDFLMISRTFTDQKEAYYLMNYAMKNNPDIAARIREAAGRVIRLKFQYLRGPNPVAIQNSFDKASKILNNNASQEYFLNQALRSITILRQDKSLILPPKSGKILVVSQYPEFIEEAHKRLPDADTHLYEYEPFYTASPADIRAISQRAANYDLIIFGLANPNSLTVLKSLEGRPVVVMSMLNPAYLNEVPWVKTAYLLYSSSPFSIKAGFAALMQDYSPDAKVPLKWLK